MLLEQLIEQGHLILVMSGMRASSFVEHREVIPQRVNQNPHDPLVMPGVRVTREQHVQFVFITKEFWVMLITTTIQRDYHPR